MYNTDGLYENEAFEEREEKRFKREMCEDSYIASSWVEASEVVYRKPVSRMQMDLFNEEVA
jgi:hypothetical protein